MFLTVCTLIFLITALVYIICLVFDVDPPEEEQQFDSWLGAAMAVGSAWAAANHEPTLKEQLMKPIKVISSKLVGKIALIISAGVVIYYAYKAIDWLFRGIWMIVTSKPFLLTIGFLALAASIFFTFRIIKRIKVENARKQNWRMCRILEDEIRDRVSIPVPEGAVTTSNYYDVKQRLKGFTADEEGAEQLGKTERFDKRLRFFYDLSIRAEAGPSVFESFTEALDVAEKSGNTELLRKDNDENRILSNKPLKQENVLTKYYSELEDDRVSPLYDQLLATAEQDTSATGVLGLVTLGLATDKNKVTKKTQQLRNLYEAALSEVQELRKTATGINEILKYTRVCAYRNIFLGAELLNYIRDNAGGKSLKTVSDSINVDFNFDIPDFNNKELSINTIGVLGSSIRSTLNYYGSNQEAANYAVENPKAALLTTGLKMIGDYFEKRAEVIDNNLNQQAEIIELFPKVVDGYLEGKSNTLRAIEIIRAIINANKGFIKIYAPLREKVFQEGIVPSLTELQQLAIATNEYNKISKTEL